MEQAPYVVIASETVQHFSLVQIVFACSILGAPLLMLVGLWLKKTWIVVLAIVVSLPLFLYLAATPRFWWVGLGVPLLSALGAWFLGRDRFSMALLATSPGLVIGVLMVFVYISNYG